MSCYRFMETGRMALAPNLLLLKPHSFDVPSRVCTMYLSRSLGAELMLEERVLVIYFAIELLTFETATDARFTLLSVGSLSSTAS